MSKKRTSSTLNFAPNGCKHSCSVGYSEYCAISLGDHFSLCVLLSIINLYLAEPGVL